MTHGAVVLGSPVAVGIGQYFGLGYYSRTDSGSGSGDIAANLVKIVLGVKSFKTYTVASGLAMTLTGALMSLVGIFKLLEGITQSPGGTLGGRATLRFIITAIGQIIILMRHGDVWLKDKAKEIKRSSKR